jgi:hypothetical protein
MIIARWHIDARFGHKQAVIESLKKWLRTIGAQIGWTENKVRIATGSVGALESTVEVDVTINDLAELNASWDLADALKAVRLAGAAMDLCDPLSVSMTDPMLDAPRTVLTPHMAWQTRETFRRAATMSVENILNYFRSEPSHVANPDALKVSRPRLQRSR